mgnify:FL=1
MKMVKENQSVNDEKMPKQVVGTFKKSRNFAFVIPDDKKIGKDIFISKSNFNKAKDNQKVVCEITKYPQKNRKAEGKIIEILGFADESGVDMLSIIKQFNLENEFPKEVIKEAKSVSKEKITSKGRVDFRDKEIFTIDSEDAKDLDDAVGVDKNDDGTYTLYVHIADVSHYVKSGGMLDKEAVIRGTSVYMLDRVIPMLPKELSNGVCSLNQHEDRYALSVIMRIDKKGKVIDSNIVKSIINVTKRMNYHNVYALIEKENAIKEESNILLNKKDNKKITEIEVGKSNKENKKSKKAKTLKENTASKSVFTKEYVERALKENKNYIEHFENMKELALILKNRRLKNGYLSLDIPESEIILDKDGKPIEIRAYETNFANEIVEQFMLTANETVAETFYYLDAPFIYRVHEKPDEEKVKELNKSLFNFGYKVKGKKDNIKPSAFSKVLEESKGTSEEKIVSSLLLHTLKIARYEAENKGHFGIASDFYCHFTSPIRRYPDLFIHRIISYYIEHNYNVTKSFLKKNKEKAIKYAKSSSDCEQNATKAERESEAMKKAEYMEDKIGNEYTGVISGVTNFGIFIELDNTIEGLIRFESMKDDFYIYNEINKTAIGKENKKVYKIGDRVNVIVKYANKEQRRINFEIA